MGLLDSLAQAWIRKRRMELGIPAEERAQTLFDQQQAERVSDEPLKSAKRQADIDAVLALTKQRLGANDARLEAARIAANARMAKTPEERAYWEAKQGEAEAKANLATSQAGYYDARTDRPQDFRAPARPPGLRAVQTVDDNGNPITSFVTPSVGLSVRGRPPAATQAKIDQANRILEIRDDLLEALKDPEIRSSLGPVSGRKQTLLEWYGNPNPKVQYFKTQLESFLAMQPALHGFRGMNSVQQFRAKANADRLDPDALAGAIQGMAEAAQSFSDSGRPDQPRTRSHWTPASPTDTSATPVGSDSGATGGSGTTGTEEWVRDPSGQLVRAR